MHLKTLILTSAVCIIASTTLFASNQTTAQVNTPAKSDIAKHDHAGYMKPGAAVALTHDYDGLTAPGEFETTTLTVNHMYEGGTLTLEILPSSDLQIFSNSLSTQHPLHAGSTLTLPIQISGTKNGTYSIGLEAVYVSLDGSQSRRVLSVPVTIGKKTMQKTQSTKSLKSTTSKSTANGFIVLPASEIIH